MVQQRRAAFLLKLPVLGEVGLWMFNYDTTPTTALIRKNQADQFLLKKELLQLLRTIFLVGDFSGIPIHSVLLVENG